MRKLITIFFSMALLILIGVGGAKLYFRENPGPVMGNADFDLTSEEIPRLEEKARGGNLRAARKLSEYYGFIRNDIPREVEWVKFAAERGDVWAERNLGTVYSSFVGFEDKNKARYWLKKAADDGDDSAKEALRILDVP